MTDDLRDVLLDGRGIIRGLATLAIVGTTCFMWVRQIPVSDPQVAAMTVALGFYFYQAQQRANDVVERRMLRGPRQPLSLDDVDLLPKVREALDRIRAEGVT